MTKLVSLASGFATDNPSLLLLRSKGYDLLIRCERRKADNSVLVVYYASCEQMSFSALSGAELLGLVTLWEAYGDGWNRQEPDVMSDIIHEEEVDDD